MDDLVPSITGHQSDAFFQFNISQGCLADSRYTFLVHKILLLPKVNFGMKAG